MKTPSPASLRPLTTLAALALAASTVLASTELPPDSTCGFLHHSGDSLPRLTLTDPGNHAWIIQSSPDLAHWTDLQTVRVYNGSLRTAFLADGTGGTRYFRSLYFSTPPDSLSTTALALDLPAPYFHPYFEQPMLMLRPLHYQGRVSAPEDGIFGAGEPGLPGRGRAWWGMVGQS